MLSCQVSQKKYIQSVDSEVDMIRAEMNILNSMSKSRPRQWHKKTLEIIQMRLRFPDATNAELASRLNVSREWIRHVLNRANLPTHAEKYCDLVCDGCGITFRKRKLWVERKRAKGKARF